MLPYVLLLHGHTGSGPGHWQSWLAGELANLGGTVDVPQLTDPGRPDLEVWLAELRHHLEVAVGEHDERVVLAHSAGAALWLHHAARLTRDHAERALRFDRVLLVAPLGPRWEHPDVHGFTPAPLDAAGVRRAAGWTQLVVGDDDEACGTDDAVEMAARLKVDLDVIPGGAHLDTVAGYGPWPAVLGWVRDKHTRMITNR
ncbi:RBBP9/YdeN family alpha/beta hydrolase [Actinophytocola sp.]|uniref:RBBP9/YdeN family alpha/beta hydrolase n=1 Tax=Actinophytocola sp. TaxID=1872138 RepID=UPI003D6BCD18